MNFFAYALTKSIPVDSEPLSLYLETRDDCSGQVFLMSVNREGIRTTEAQIFPSGDVYSNIAVNPRLFFKGTPRHT